MMDSKTQHDQAADPSVYKKYLILWCILTAISASLGVAAWVYHVDGIVRIAANGAYVFSIPGWIPVYMFGLIGVRDLPIAIFIANGLAWIFWLGLFAIACSVRTKLVEPSATAEPQSINVGRRKFLSSAAIGTVTVGAVATPGYAALIEPWDIKVRKYTIPIKNLDPALNGLKLVQLADTHLGPRIPASFVKQAIDLVVAQSPDLVLLTGDHIHDGTKEIELAAELCQPLIQHAAIGVVGVLGNHDWWGSGHAMSLALREQGVKMIDNDRLWIDPKTRALVDQDPGAGGLAIVGVGDLDEDVIDVTSAFRDVADQTPRVLLSHNPDVAELAALVKPGSPRVDLMCSGHTHGGQVRIPLVGTPLVPSRFGSKYAGGLVNGPAFPVHISRGVGMSMLPVRVGVPPEISVLTLTQA